MITIAVPKAANNATIIAIIGVKAWVIEIHPIVFAQAGLLVGSRL